MAEKDRADTDLRADLEQATELLETVRAELQAERSASSGKDRKLTSLQQELKDLQDVASGKRHEESGERQRLMEIAADLKARSKLLEDQEAALNKAMEKGVPINLMLRGTGDLDTFMDELTQFKNQFLDAHPLFRRKKSTPEDAEIPDLKKLSTKEIARIPDRIFQKLSGEGKTYGL